jgi:copper transport protein
VIHVSAASIWIGGLVTLVFFVLPRRNDDLRAVVRRFSEIAFWAVVALVGTGVFQGYRQVGSIDALKSTPYGKLLLIKTGTVVLMLVFAWLSRRATRARWTPDTTAKLRRSVGIEAALAVVVLSVTGLLVNAVPAKVLAAAPQSGELSRPTMLIDYTVSPGRAGVNNIHLYALSKAGQPEPVVEMDLKMSLPSKNIAGITIPLQNAGPGHYQSLNFTLPLKGTWQMNVIARTSNIDEETFQGNVSIR